VAHSRPLLIEASDNEYVAVFSFEHAGGRDHVVMFVRPVRLHCTSARAEHLHVQFVVTEIAVEQRRFDNWPRPVRSRPSNAEVIARHIKHAGVCGPASVISGMVGDFGVQRANCFVVEMCESDRISLRSASAGETTFLPGYFQPFEGPTFNMAQLREVF